MRTNIRARHWVQNYVQNYVQIRACMSWKTEYIQIRRWQSCDCVRTILKQHPVVQDEPTIVDCLFSKSFLRVI